MATSTLVVALVVVTAVLWAVAYGARLPLPYRGRQCQGKHWRRSFPSASKQEIREFLTLFGQAFSVSKQERLKFSPDDEILEVYQARYPIKGAPDMLELEILARDIQAKYGFNLESAWRPNLTLGELFSIVRGVSNA